jgi:hypothetical protein
MSVLTFQGATIYDIQQMAQLADGVYTSSFLGTREWSVLSGADIGYSAGFGGSLLNGSMETGDNKFTTGVQWSLLGSFISGSFLKGFSASFSGIAQVFLSRNQDKLAVSLQRNRFFTGLFEL